MFCPFDHFAHLDLSFLLGHQRKLVLGMKKYGSDTSVGKNIKKIRCDCQIYDESGGYHPEIV